MRGCPNLPDAIPLELLAQRADLSTLPVPVIGNSSRNSTASGIHQLAILGRIWSSRVLPSTVAPFLRTTSRSGTLLPFVVRDGDHGGLQHVRMGQGDVLELDGGDPFAARLDHVLGAAVSVTWPCWSITAMSPVISQPSLRGLPRASCSRRRPRGRGRANGRRSCRRAAARCRRRRRCAGPCRSRRGPTWRRSRSLGFAEMLGAGPQPGIEQPSASVMPQA